MRGRSRICSWFVSFLGAAVEHLPGDLAGRLRQAASGDEPGDLLDPFFPAELARAGEGPLFLDPLVDAEVVGCGRGDLGEMGDTDHLVAGRQPAELPGEEIRRLAADARVALVEDERPEALLVLAGRLERQHHPRQLAARSDPPEGARLLARVG